MAETTKAPDDEPRREGRLDATDSLLARARLGDRSAPDLLAARVRDLIRRWARRRLPSPRARRLMGTDNFVQVTLLRALDHVKELEPRHEGALLPTWRRILIKQVRAEASRTAGLPEIPRSIPIHAAATKNGMWFHKIALKRAAP